MVWTGVVLVVVLIAVLAVVLVVGAVVVSMAGSVLSGNPVVASIESHEEHSSPQIAKPIPIPAPRNAPSARKPKINFKTGHLEELSGSIS